MATTSEMIDQDRRRVLGMATMGIAVATAASLFPSRLTAASAGDAIRPFHVNIPAARHSHPGEDLVHVTEGSLEYQLDGRPPVIVRAGEVLSIPHGTPHAVKNVGTGKATELATYIVEKGKPLLALSA